MPETQYHVLRPLLLRMHSKRRRFWTTSMRGAACIFRSERRPEVVTSIFRSVELFEALNALKVDSTVGQYILDVRGQGLMAAIEFASPSHSTFDPAVKKDATANLAMKISKRCLEKGMLLLTTSVYETVRFIPPLNISSEDLARGISIFKEAVKEVVQER